MGDQKFQVHHVQGVPVSDADLLKDVIRVARDLHSETVPRPKYQQLGKYSHTTISRRFGSWNKALEKAGLALSNEKGISDERMFENVLTLWQHYGRQPRLRELSKPPSFLSEGPYLRRFRSWTAALDAFVQFANNTEAEPPGGAVVTTNSVTKRDPSLRLRWKVLKRDNFTCRGCGASPATRPGVELHVDHIVAWSNGGETVLANLQTLCTNCNYGKSNT